MNLTQLRALIWLRWRLSRNQWRRRGQINAVITLLGVVIGLGLAVLGGIGGVLVGSLAMKNVSGETMLFVWDGLIAMFLFCWMIGLITELQRSEMLDLHHLLHLPVSLKDVFVLNYLASNLTPSMAIGLPAMLGLAVGLILGSGPAMVLMLPLVFGFFLMVTAWTYCLRGWLAALMVNKRRRRAVVMGVTMTFILLCQLPNLITNVWLRDHKHEHKHTRRPPITAQENPSVNPTEQKKPFKLPPAVEMVHRYVPLLWLSQGARGLAEGNFLQMAWTALGMIALGGWGMIRSYRGMLRFYQGGETDKPAPIPKKVKPAAPSKSSGRLLVERAFPGMPEQVSAMGMAVLRSMLRAPEVKMGLAMNFVIFAILGVTMVFGHGHGLPAGARPFAAAAAVAMTFMGLTQVMANQFGFDREAFRLFVLLPAPRRHLLLGKNLAVAPIALTMFCAYLVAVSVVAKLHFWDLLAAPFLFVAGLAVVSMIGNVTSILVPYRIAPGTLKPTKTNSLTSLLIFLVHFLMMPVMGLFMMPALLGLLCGRTCGIPQSLVTLVLAMVMAAVAVGFYWLMLGPMGRLFEQREKKILDTVTSDVE